MINFSRFRNLDFFLSPDLFLFTTSQLLFKRSMKHFRRNMMSELTLNLKTSLQDVFGCVSPDSGHMCVTCHVVYSRCKVNKKANGHTSRGLRGPPPPEQRSRGGGGERGAAASSWMGTLYDNRHHFPSEDNTLGLFARAGLQSNWSIWCKFCVESAVRVRRMALSLNLLHRLSGFPALSLKLFLPLIFFISAPQSFSLFPFCATNHYYGFLWHLLRSSPKNTISKLQAQSNFKPKLVFVLFHFCEQFCNN